MRLRLMAPLAACVVAAACGMPGAAVKQPAARPSATADAAAAARCQRLVERQVSPCPPANLPLEQIVIHNGTHGVVADADVQTQGRAYLRAHALYTWAVKQDAGDKFLVSGATVAPETARTNLYRGEIKVYTDAAAAHGVVHIEPLTTTEITLVPVPQALRDIAKKDGLQPTPYAWVDNQMGPAHAWITLPDGSTRDEVRIGTGQPEPILVFGEVRSDADLGTIWYMGGFFGCLGDGTVRAVCEI